MKKIITNILNSIDKDLIFTGINQLWRLISGPLTLIFITLFLSKELQGFWFTFISLSALSTFADLGFTNIVLQFSAHEFAYLNFGPKSIIEGDEDHLKKLASLLAFSLKWVALMLSIAFPIILLVGIIVFSKKTQDINWMYPWIIYLIGAAISFFANSILSFVEGCNSVAKVQNIRFKVSTINVLVMLILLYFGFNLYSLAISMLVSSLITFNFLFYEFRGFFKQLLNIAKSFKYSWKAEFFRLLWRYSITAIGGFYIFQIYTPLAFTYHGALEAGRVGLSISIWTAFFNISNVWLMSIYPKLNMYISKKKWDDLDKLFFKNLTLSICTFIIGAISILALFKVLVKITDRIMDPFAMICLGISWLLQVVVNGLALYLRAHKEEPLVHLSILDGIYILITTFLCAKILPPKYLFLGFLSSFIWVLPWLYNIFFSKRKLWHD